MINYKILKLCYSVLFVFSAVLTYSYSNIARGGAVLWIGSNMFYFSMLIFASTLTYIILNSNYNYFQKLEFPGVLLFCLSLPLLFNIGIHQFPPDLDSIISMKSIPFIINNGFSVDLAGNNNLLIHATYSLPMLSIFGASFMQILGVTYIVTAKYTILILASIFFLVYYAFVSKFIDKKVALLSLILISTFVWGYSGVLNNVDLALVFVLLSWWFIFWRKHSGEYNINVVLIQILILITFVMTHHLTYFVYILSIIFLFLYLKLSNTMWESLKQKNTWNIIILAIILMISYYVYVYFGPLNLIINALTNQLIVEAKPTSEITKWTFPIILQRTSYVIFLVLPAILSIIEARKNIKDFLSKTSTIFLVMGIFLFSSSIVGITLKAPFNWDRIAVFGWMLYIPGAVNILIKSEILKNNFIKQGIIIFTFSLLVFGNIYAIPVNLMDHSGDRDYEGTFKNWIKLQEWDSALFLNKTINHNSLIVGDEVVYRMCAVNFPNNNVNFNYFPDNFSRNNSDFSSWGLVAENNKQKDDSQMYLNRVNVSFSSDMINNSHQRSDVTYLVFRNENIFRIIQSFYQKKTNNKNEPYGTVLTQDDETAIRRKNYEEINSGKGVNLIYDNKEVNIFQLTVY